MARGRGLCLRTCFILRHVCDGGEVGCSSRRIATTHRLYVRSDRQRNAPRSPRRSSASLPSSTISTYGLRRAPPIRSVLATTHHRPGYETGSGMERIHAKGLAPLGGHVDLAIRAIEILEQSAALLVCHAPLLALVALRGTPVAPIARVAPVAPAAIIPPAAVALLHRTLCLKGRTVRRAPALRSRQRRCQQSQDGNDQEHPFHRSIPQRSICHV